jgi:hypothetical protein
MPAMWNAVRSLIANPAILKAGPALDVFLCRYMRKFRLREVGGHLIVHSHLPPLNSAAFGRFALPENVWVADGSRFPESPGGPPILTIMALARRVARAVAAAA